MKVFVEAVRRLLILIVWAPTAIYFGFVIANLEEALAELSDLLPISIGFIFGSSLAHFILNWIFQVNERANEADNEDDDSGLLTVEGYMDKQQPWLTVICFGWLLGMIWLGHHNNSLPTPYWGMWSSVENFTAYWGMMWLYFTIGFGGFFLIRVLIQRSYENKLRRLGLIR